MWSCDNIHTLSITDNYFPYINFQLHSGKYRPISLYIISMMFQIQYTR